MLFKYFKLAFLALSLLSTNAFASLITLETQDYTGGTPSTDYRTAWDALDGDITSTTLDEFTNVKSGNKRFNHLTIEFDMAYDGMWSLMAGLDAGLGAEIYLDGVSVIQDTTNIWWANRWNHGDVLRLDDLALNSGTHTIEFFWIENCCNGANNIRFTDYRTGLETSLNLGAINAATVPEPMTIGLLGLSLLGLGFSLRSRRK